jgi:hypothetical protein
MIMFINGLLLFLYNTASAEWVNLGKTSEGDDFQYNNAKILKNGDKMYFSVKTGEGSEMLVATNCKTSKYMFRGLETWSDVPQDSFAKKLELKYCEH